MKVTTKRLLILGLLAVCLLCCWQNQQKRPVLRAVWRAVQVWLSLRSPFWEPAPADSARSIPPIPDPGVYQASADGVLQHSQGW